MAKSSSSPHIAIFPSPGMGHLIPLVEFAKRLIDQHGFYVTLIMPSDGPINNAQKKFLDKLPQNLDFIPLPPVDLSDLPVDARIETRIAQTGLRSIPSLREVVRSLVAKTNLTTMVVDLFGTDAFDVAKEFNMHSYIFYCSTAMALSLFLYLPELDASVSGEYVDMAEKIQIPGCIPIHGKDLWEPAQDRKNDAYKSGLYHAKRYGLADGIMVNSFKELEPGPIEYLMNKEDGKPSVYPVGPLVRTGLLENVEEDCVCTKWLDTQPSGSVLYVSFGSGGTLSRAQIIELASGLEMSEQRFLWVVRTPNDKSAFATFFSDQNPDDPLAYLPQGFLDRTKGRGLVVPLWAPQARILSHESTGGFLTHCGWNSTLESLVNGVPLIAWPLYAEQKQNAVELAEDIKVALRVKFGEDGLVRRVEIANAVKGLMEGEQGKGIRSRMRDLKAAAEKAVSEDGSSTKALAELALKWKSKPCT